MKNIQATTLTTLTALSLNCAYAQTSTLLPVPPEQLSQSAVLSLLQTAKPKYAYVFVGPALDTAVLNALIEARAKGMTLQLICDPTSCTTQNMQLLKTRLTTVRLPATLSQNMILTDIFMAAGGLNGKSPSTLIKDPSVLKFMRESTLAPLEKAPRLQ